MISSTMASRTASRYVTSILCASKIVSPPLLRPYPRLPRTLQPVAHRFAHTIPRPTKSTQNASASSSETSSEPKSRKLLEPHYQLTFTCVPCSERSSHTVSKQGYHKGSVLITCPSCRNRHVISDNLNIFGDRKITIEDLLREKGQLVKRGTLGEEGDIEFWEDTSTDMADIGEASAASVQEEAARRLRDTRDPSSQTTNPTPSASVLSNTGNRSPVHGITYQSPLPSTRRQFHTKRFQPPISIQQRGVQPIDPTKEIERKNRDDASFDSEVHTPFDSPTDERATSLTRQDIALSDKLRDLYSKTTLSPPNPTGFTRVRYIKGSERKVMDKPMVRKVMSEIHYTGPRFVPSDHRTRIAVQLQPGVLYRRRPRNGVVVEESLAKAPEAPEAPKRRPFFRPSFLPLLPNPPPSQT